MPRVNGYTVILVLSSFSHKLPVPLLLTQVETCSMRDEHHGQTEAYESKPTDDPEFRAGTNIVVQDSCRQRAALPDCSRQPMRSGSYWGRIDLRCIKKCCGIRSELDPEG